MTIHLLSNPRNLSTALMYSFAQRPNMIVVDEPYYAAYLCASGVDHPGKDEILEVMPRTYDAVDKQINDLKKEHGDLFIKNMAHHMARVDHHYSRHDFHIIYIRDPKLVLNSFHKVVSEPTIADIAIKFQYLLRDQFEKQEIPYYVLDSADLILSPKEILKEICHHAGVPFYDDMLTWGAGPKPYDGPWSKYWYSNVHQSTSFSASKRSVVNLPSYLNPVYEEALYYYHKLKEV